MLSSRQLGLKGMTAGQCRAFGGARPESNVRTYTRIMLAAADAVKRLRMRAVAAGVLVGVAQGRSVALGPLASGAQDETGHRIELVGDGAQAQPPGLKRDAAAAGGYIQDDGSRRRRGCGYIGSSARLGLASWPAVGPYGVRWH